MPNKNVNQYPYPASVRFDKEVFVKLEQRCQETGLTKGQLIRKIVTEWLAKE